MEESFTGGFYPDLDKYAPVSHKNGEKKDFIPKELCGFYAVAFDSCGRLGWRTARIVDPDGDEGYDGAQIIEVLSEMADGRYLAYLEELGIPYIFAGRDSIEVETALVKLKEIFGCNTLLLEGGSIINGAFERAGAIDELSLVISPAIAGKESSPLFDGADISDFELISSEREGDNLILKYRRRK